VYPILAKERMHRSRKYDDAPMPFMQLINNGGVALHGGRNVSVDFLGQPAAFPQGPWLLAGLLRCPLNLMSCLKIDGRYRVTLEPFAECVQWKRGERDAVIRAWVQRYAERLGQRCLEAPDQWFNFYPFWKPHDDPSA